MSKELQEKNANSFRQANGLSLTEPIRIKSILQSNQILTVYRKLSSGFSGMAIRTGTPGSYKRFILINSDHSIGKQHFTLCHELYHLFFQENFVYSTSAAGKFDPKGDKEEYNADLFASRLLLPTAGIQKLIPDHEMPKNRITLKTILSIENYFSSSRSALLYRLKELGHIDTSFYNQYSTKIIHGALSYGYQTDLYNSGNDNLVIGDYGIIARDLFDGGKISESHYFTLLEDIGINIQELEDNGCRPEE